LGNLYARWRRFAEAEEQLSKVTQLVPDHHFGYSNLGAVYLYEGRYSEAIPVLDHSVKIRDTVEAYSNLGTAHFFLRRFSEAAAAYEKAIGLNESDWRIWGNLGDARYWDPKSRARAGEAYRKALTLGEESLQLNPRDTTLLGWMTYYHAMLDEEEAVRNCMQLALAEDPQDPELFFNLAQSFCRLGDKDKALHWLKKAMAAGQPLETVKNTPLFDELRNSREFQGILGDD
jgi:serine/threonine-protein kinase